MERERPQAQQNAPKLFKAWSGSNRRSLPCSHSWEGDPRQPCTVLIHFWLLMALSARAGSCRVQKLLPAPQRDPAGAAGLQDPGQSRTSQPQPRQHRHSSGACSAQRPQQHLLPLDILHTAPPGITCAKERASPSLCSRISLVVQQVWLFKSNSWGTACPLLLAAHSLQSRVIIWGTGWYQGASSFPPCLCRLDTHTTVTTASLRRDIPFSAFKFNSPSKTGSSDELAAAEEGTFFCLLGL